VVKTTGASRDRHPETAVLAIEVARESLRQDRKVRGALYAALPRVSFPVAELLG
jgi:hypothetical protein